MAGARKGDLVAAHRSETVDDGEPLFVSSVTVHSQGRGSGTPYVTPTSTGAEIVGIEAGDEVTVEVYQDGVFIRSE